MKVDLHVDNQITPTEIEWPDNWPLPLQGDVIQMGQDYRITNVIFDIPGGKIHIRVRKLNYRGGL